MLQLSIEHSGMFTYYTLLKDGDIISGAFDGFKGDPKIAKKYDGEVDILTEGDTDMSILEYTDIIGDKMVNELSSLTKIVDDMLRQRNTVLDYRSDGSVVYIDSSNNICQVDSRKEVPTDII